MMVVHQRVGAPTVLESDERTVGFAAIEHDHLDPHLPHDPHRLREVVDTAPGELAFLELIGQPDHPAAIGV